MKKMNSFPHPPFFVQRPVFIILTSVILTCVGSCGLNGNPVGKSTVMDYMLSPINQEFPLQFYFSDIPGSFFRINYSEPEESDTANLDAYLKLFTEEFAKYPDALREASRIQNVVIVKDLTVSGQKRSGLPDYFRNTLYLDFLSGYYNRTYQRHTLHHEHYHMIEQKVNGNAYWKDPQWAAFNDPSFQYGSGGASAQGNSNAYFFTHPLTGFVNEYSMSGLEEDKAEIFAALFTAGEYEKITAWAQTDPILAAKINYMKDFLHNISPEIDEDFWVRLHPQNPSST